MAKIIVGTMPFKGLKTWYRIIGDNTSGRAPLLLLHGGPGSTHNYMELFDVLADEGRQIICYDQIGCGNSPADGRKDLFTCETWLQELIALRQYLQLDQVHILGQSWGGMLLLSYVCTKYPQGIKSIILSSTLPSSALWAKEQHRMIRELPEKMQQAIKDAETTGDFSGAAYDEANNEYMLRHCSPIWGEDAPECLRRPKKAGREAYVTAWGPNEFTPLGNLKDFDHLNDLSHISVPSLITSGTNDLCTPLIAKAMADRIPDAKWVLFPNSRHMPFAEETEDYMGLMKSWLSSHD